MTTFFLPLSLIDSSANVLVYDEGRALRRNLQNFYQTIAQLITTQAMTNYSATIPLDSTSCYRRNDHSSNTSP